MSVQWLLVPKLIGVLAHHLRARGETAATDAAVLAKNLRRRLLATLIAMGSAALFVSLGVAWIFGIVWNTPWRNPVLGMLLGVLALCAIVSAVLASRPRMLAKGSFAGPRKELSLDQSPADTGRNFPRSATMRLLLNLKGLGGLLRH